MNNITLNDTDGFTFHGWMVNRLHLEGGDLLAFALVHQFTQSNAGIYKGNTSYLSAWTGWSERTSRAHLIALQEKGLIAEVRGRENNSPFCYYQLGPAFYEAVKSTPQKLQGEGAKIAPTTPQKFPEAPRKNCGENIHIESTSEIIPPTPREVEDYVRSRGWTDPSGFAAYYCSYHAVSGWRMSNGKKIQNWKLNVVSWEPNNKTRVFSTPKAPASSTAPARQLTDEEFRDIMRQ